MTPTPSLVPLSEANRPVVRRLWQLYRHDLAEFRGGLPGPDGAYGPGRLPTFLGEDPDRGGYLLRLGELPVGFALVRGLREGPTVAAEFFVVRAARRHGVGRAAVLALLARHPGRWEIPFQEQNAGAARFWRRVATAAAGDDWHEERRPVPGRPELPPDTWLVLTPAV